MLSKVLSFLGIDLQQQANQLQSQIQARAEVFRDRTLDRTSQEVKHVSAILGFAVAGALLALVTVGLALGVLYLWLVPQYGPLVALGATAIATAVAGAAMFMIAKSVAQRRPAPLPPLPQPVVAAPPAPRATPVATTAQAASSLAALVPPPAGASLLDIVSHRVTAKAAGASEEAVETAVDMVRNGSRGALYGTIAVTALIGLLIGRRRA